MRALAGKIRRAATSAIILPLIAMPAASSSAQLAEPEGGQGRELELAIRLPEGPVYAGVPLPVSVEVANNGGTEIKLSKYALGRERRLEVRARDEQGKSVRPPVPIQVEFWQDTYFLPPTVPPVTTWGALDMLMLPTPGEYSLEARLTSVEGQTWEASPTALQAQWVPPDDPFLGIAAVLGFATREAGRQAMAQFYYQGTSRPPSLPLDEAVDRLLAMRPWAKDSAYLEALLTANILSSTRRDLDSSYARGPRIAREELIKRCTWFELNFPHSFLLPEVRYRKALLLAADGQEDDAKALLRKERQRSPIAQLLYRNLATISADAARLLKDEE